MNLLPDLLNFMAAHKWELFKIDSGYRNVYIFKREFDASEIKK
ncbi:hypothetical protein [Rhizosphaericola mali]|nr:hypothetical protein [Rhizosphaericola mali]